MLSVSRGFRNLAYFGQRLQTKFLSFGPTTHKLSMTTPQSSTFCYTFHKIYNLVQMATCVELYFVQFHFERIYQQRGQDSCCHTNWKNNHFAGFLLKKKWRAKAMLPSSKTKYYKNDQTNIWNLKHHKQKLMTCFTDMWDIYSLTWFYSHFYDHLIFCLKFLHKHACNWWSLSLYKISFVDMIYFSYEMAKS